MKRNLVRICINLRNLSLILSLALVLSSLGSMFVGTKYEVKAANPTIITDVAGLDAIRQDLTGDYILGADIDLNVAPYNTNEGWKPIGEQGDPFIGSFDGDGYTISGLMINRPTEDNIGLFGYASSGNFTNVKLLNVHITGKNRVGALVGYDPGDNGMIIDSSVHGLVTGVTNVGGLVGRTHGDIESSSSVSDVSGESYIGGLAGEVDGKIMDSHATGDILGNGNVVGGLVGFISEAVVTNSYATGDVTGAGFVGGLIGIANPGEIANSYATGKVEGSEDYAGGLIGNIMNSLQASSSVTSSYALGDVSGDGLVGGLIGNVNAEVTESFSKGNVSGTGSRVGGLAGSVTGLGKLTDTYAAGTVLGGSEVGALVGRLAFSGSITNSYALAGTIPLTGVSAGVDVVVTDSFYLKGSTNNNDPKRGIAKTNAELTEQSTFANWDLTTVWELPIGQYPRLQWEATIGLTGNVIYVKQDGAGNEDGTRWGDAFATLQEALDIADVEDQIWIAKGTYYPTKALNIANDRTKTFQMKDGVAIYGGFAGNEAADFDLNNRDFTLNETILSGDLGVPNDTSDNAYHVFYNIDVSDSASIDGVTITGGNADRGTNHSDHEENSGGGIFNLRSSPIIKNVRIIKNEAKYRGGGIFNHDSNPYLENVTVENNEVKENRIGDNIPSGGGGMNNYGESEVVIKASIFEGNQSANNGGGIINGDHYSSTETKTSHLHLIDVVIKDNEAPFGGGIANTLNGSITVNGGEIKGNTTSALASGGGIYNQSGEMTLNDVSITENEAGQGAGIYVTGSSSSITINNGTISSNEADNTDGAGINIQGQNTTVNVLGTKIENNYAKGNGAGIFIDGSGEVHVHIKEVILSGNEAGYNNNAGNGGGIQNSRTKTDGVVIIEDTIIKDNKSKGHGGGLSSFGGIHTLNRVVISGNDAGVNGGGIYSVNSAINSNNNTEIYPSKGTYYNVLIANNEAAARGGGMHHTYGGSSALSNVTIAGNIANSGGAIFNERTANNQTFPDPIDLIIHNSIIWGNSSSIVNIDAAPVFSHSIVEGSGGSGAWDDDFGINDAGNVDENPLFVNQGNGNYRLNAGSPAIDSGDNALIPAGITTDLDGNVRTIDTVDIGAYEFGSNPPNKEIISVDDLADITVVHGTDMAGIGLPAQVKVTLDDQSIVNLAINWDGGVPVYDGNIAGNYEFSGTLTLIQGISNSADHQAELTVVVSPAPPIDKEIISVENLSAITVNYGTDLVGIGLPAQVEVTLDDQSKVNLDVVWDGGTPAYDGNTAGTYEFAGQLTLDANIINPNDISASIDVTVRARQSVPSIPGGIIWGGSNDASLKQLDIYDVDDIEIQITPSFEKDLFYYEVETAAEKVKIMVEATHQAAKVTLEDEEIKESIILNLVVGKNEFVFTVKAEDGSTKNYKLHIVRTTEDQEKDGPPYIYLKDVVGHWAERIIVEAVAEGIVTGHPDQRFRPDHFTTRAEFTVMLANALKLNNPTIDNSFVDHDLIGDWAKQAVAGTVKQKIIFGYEDGTFRPNQTITRAEMMSMIARALQLNQNMKVTGFEDDAYIPTWAKGAVEASRLKGIVEGRGNNQFFPLEQATRAESLAVIVRMMKLK